MIVNCSDLVLSCLAVMNNPELPLDPNLQTTNLLITFLKYASIVMQDTKGKQPSPSGPPPSTLSLSGPHHSSFSLSPQCPHIVPADAGGK